MADFYTDVYTRQNVSPAKEDVINFLNSDNDNTPMETLNSRRIPDNIKDEMEIILSKDKLTKAFFENMKPNSAPGIDGFSVLFVSQFWDSLVDLVWRSFSSMKNEGTLTSTLKTAILKLLRKGTKDSTLPGNYRPISLLSVFYKIASCAISNRIKKALPFIIGKQQKAYVTNDNIGSVLINILGICTRYSGYWLRLTW